MKVTNKIRLWYLKNILKVLNCSADCIIEEGVYISTGIDKVSIGHHTHINENVFIQAAKIGNYVLIAPNVCLLSNSHVTSRIDIPMMLQGMTSNDPVIVEDDVWIGRNVVVMPGCKIGTGSIIGAGAIVTKNIPPFSIAVGVPAKVIKKRK
uniref:acyltransferase n=1 Tax=Flavobacterium phragmitis TaxID=739143 RepID=UPI0029373B1A|nr:DapH/DapD/GlmU-related protein [Flavobacterium phragmitis]